MAKSESQKVTKASLKADLHKMGIKTYRNTKTKESFVKRSEVVAALEILDKKAKAKTAKAKVSKVSKTTKKQPTKKK